MGKDALIILKKIVDNCPVCRGKGEVKKWIADPGIYRGVKSCPYCSEARKFLNIPAS
jgi:hypothetical protein